jgi:DNA recombination protein RmuC
MSVLGELENRLGQLTKQASDIEAVGANIQKLSELLRPPKLRGNVGELLLDNILGQILPPALFHSQYRFDSGLRVDAAIKLGDRLLPIDAKFPIESFERVSKEPENPELQKQFSRDFKKHIDAIADKYIRPTEKTTDFAIMYIPAEAVYYQLIAQRHQEGFEYALSRRVIPSSPGHLYAFLSSVAMLGAELSLAGSGLADEGRRFLSGLNELTETTERLGRFHDKMESSLRALSAGFARARTELSEARMQLEKLRQPLTAHASTGAEKEPAQETASESDSSPDG